MFFKVKGAKHGDINGEAQDQKHKNEIEVLSWSWGMQGKASISTGAATGKATMRELRIVKKVDKASTALMAALHERGDRGRGPDRGTSKLDIENHHLDGRVMASIPRPVMTPEVPIECVFRSTRLPWIRFGQDARHRARLPSKTGGG
jgi:hypothetical protein